jgi:hypothetical protein
MTPNPRNYPVDRQVVTLNSMTDGPGPNAVSQESCDVLVWDERETWCEFWEWPTHHRRTHCFSTACSPESFKHFALGDILDLGWEVVSCTTVRCGFLWLSEARIWTFRRTIRWLRDGSGTRFIGHRVTPTMPKQFHERDDGY